MENSHGVLRIVAIDSIHASDPDVFEYPDGARRHGDEPVWAVYENDPDEGGTWNEVASGLTLQEAENER